MIKINKEHAEICGFLPEICAEYCCLIRAFKDEKFTSKFLHACIDDVFENNEETRKKLKESTEEMLKNKYKKKNDELREGFKKLLNKLIEGIEEDLEELDDDKN